MSIAKIIACGAALVAIRLPDTRAEPAPSPTYTITDVGTLGGRTSVALGINERGQIVGSADTPQGHRRAYIWENGVMTDLGTVPGGVQSEAWDVNNLGQVVGFSGRFGVMWWQGEVIDLGTFPGGPFGPTAASAINDAGQIVGDSYSGWETHAFLWENGQMTDLTSTFGTAGGIARDINRSGAVIVGPTLLNEDRTVTTLPTLGGEITQGFSLNEQSAVVGWSERIPGERIFHAFLWDDGIMTDLGALGGLTGSSAEAINVCGQVVGWGIYEGGKERIEYPFLYDPHGEMHNLNDLLPPANSWSGLSPRDINDLGQIVGAGTIQGRRHAFVMTPLDNSGDDDGDGVPDCIDRCPGVDDAADGDADGIPDCIDSCPGVDDEVFGPCEPDEIPTMSEWGLIILTLTLLAAAKVCFGWQAP